MPIAPLSVPLSGPPPSTTYYDSVAEARLRWQLLPGYLQAHERRLLKAAVASTGPHHGPGDRRILEVGCGGGANLANGQWGPATLVGIDLSFAALAAGKRAGVPAAWVCSDAVALPFQSSSFDLVFCRDLLHHLPREGWEVFLRDAKRVLKPDGRFVVVESSARNPLVFCQALVLPEESGQLRSGPRIVRQLLAESGATIESEHMLAPLPLALALFNFRFPWAGTVAWPPIGAALNMVDRVAGVLLPASRWAYYSVVARLGGAESTGRPADKCKARGAEL